MLLKLPYPTSVNSHYITCKNGFKTLSKKARAYRECVRAVILSIGFKSPILYKCIAWVELHPPDLRVRDTDNTQKSLFDALQYSGVILNDCLIVEHHVKMMEKVSGGMALVKFEKVENSNWTSLME